MAAMCCLWAWCHAGVPACLHPGGGCWRLPCMAAGRVSEWWSEKLGIASAVGTTQCCSLLLHPGAQYAQPVSVHSVSVVDMGGRNGDNTDMCVRTRGYRGLAGELGCCVHWVLPAGSGPGV